MQREAPLPRLREVLDIDSQVLRLREVRSGRLPHESRAPLAAVQEKDDIIRPLSLDPRLMHRRKLIQRNRRCRQGKKRRSECKRINNRLQFHIRFPNLRLPDILLKSAALDLTKTETNTKPKPSQNYHSGKFASG